MNFFTPTLNYHYLSSIKKINSEIKENIAVKTAELIYIPIPTKDKLHINPIIFEENFILKNFNQFK